MVNARNPVVQKVRLGDATYEQRFVRCGKRTCHCAVESDKGHGPYWYRLISGKDGSVRRVYIGKVLNVVGGVSERTGG